MLLLIQLLVVLYVHRRSWQQRSRRSTAWTRTVEQQNIRCLSRECSRQRRSVRQTTGEVGAGNSLLSRWLKYDWTQGNVVPAPPINFLFHSGGCCWLSGNALVLINVVALRRARLVLEWVTVRGYATLVYLTKPPRRNEYWRCSRSPLRKKTASYA